MELPVCKKQEFYERLQELFETKKASSKLNYSRLSALAGFSSRNYAREVIKGSKFPTMEALEKILSAMSAPECDKQILRLLHTEIKNPDLMTTEMSLRLLRLRKKPGASLNPSVSAPYQKGYLPLILAAVGSQSQGTTFEKICRRSGYSSVSVEAALKKLIESELIICENNRYFMKENHLVYEALGGSEAFQEFYLEGLDRARRQAKRNFTSKEKLFLHSSFTIPEASVADLREALKVTMLEFIDKHQKTSGDKLAHLSVSFFAND